MKRVASLIALGSALLLGAGAVVSAGGFSVKLLDGGTFVRDEEKPMLLKFWASWCTVCLEQMPAYHELYDSYGDRVQFLSVNAAINDSPEQARATAAEYELTMPLAYDESGALWEQFDIVGTPMYVLVDRDGTVRYTHFTHDERLEEALDAVLASRVPASAGLRFKVVADGGGPTDIDGQPFSLEAGEDETVVAYHFATWCETYLRETDPARVVLCREFREGLDRLAARNLPGLRIIGFATRNGIKPKNVRDYRERHGVGHQLVWDVGGTFETRFGVNDFPHAVLIRDGEVVHSSDGIDVALIEELASR